MCVCGRDELMCRRTCERRGKWSGFLLSLLWPTRQTAATVSPFSPAAVWVRSNSESRRPASILTENLQTFHSQRLKSGCWKCTFLSGARKPKFWSVCEERKETLFASLLRRLVKLTEGVFGIQHERVNWTLNLSHREKKKKEKKKRVKEKGKKNNTTEYLHNRLYLQFLGRKEKEKDTGDIGD